ncbi:MAG TPA: ribosome assembly factor SBDS [Desulfurococcales archaeon]|nr:ribosome assembly factor SBDS [Desulfurococcales archaeon]
MPKQNYVIARLVSHGHTFEILVKPDLAFKFKEGKKVDIREILVGDLVYKDARKGLKASLETIRKVFGTTDIYKVAEIILKKGELQLTAEQRKALINAKKKQIIAFIAKNCIDPKTGLPHPPKRIELAMEQAKVGVDPFKDVESQAIQIIKAISRILPIKIAKAYVQVTIPAQYSGRAYSVLTGFGEVKRTQWRSDGSLLMELEIPAGLQQELIDKVNALTKGSGEVKILYRK